MRIWFVLPLIVAMACLAGLAACGNFADDAAKLGEADVEFNIVQITRAAGSACPEDPAQAAAPPQFTEIKVDLFNAADDLKTAQPVMSSTIPSAKKGDSQMITGIPVDTLLQVVVTAKAGADQVRGVAKICYDSAGQPAGTDANGSPACQFSAGQKRYVGIALSAVGKSSCLGAMMNTRRIFHQATVLNDGRVLITGGFSAYEPQQQYFAATASAEIYDPKTGTITALPNMDKPRAMHTATATPTGDVIIAGGAEYAFYTPTSATAPIRPPAAAANLKIPAVSASYIIFRPSTNDFDRDQKGTVRARQLNVGRAMHQATLVLLQAGQGQGREFYILLSGGDGARQDPEMFAAQTFEIFTFLYKADSTIAPKVYSMVPDRDLLPYARLGHAAFAVPGGKVFLWGGLTGPGSPIQIYSAPPTVAALEASHGGVTDYTGLNTAGVADPAELGARFLRATKYNDQLYIVSGGVVYKDGRPDFEGAMATNPLLFLLGLGTTVSVNPVPYKPGATVSARLFGEVATTTNGDVLLIGGSPDETLNSSVAEIDGILVDAKNPAAPSGTAQYRGLALSTPRFGMVATPLPDGTVLVTGGMSSLAAGQILRSAEVINVAAPQ